MEHELRKVGAIALMISATQSLLGLASGMLVGFSLGLVGGGGSVLAVPLMVRGGGRNPAPCRDRYQRPCGGSQCRDQPVQPCPWRHGDVILRAGICRSR